MYHSFNPHCRRNFVSAPNLVKCEKTTILPSGRISSKLVAEENSSDSVFESLAPFKVADFSISVAVATGNVSQLKPNAVIPVSDFNAADVASEVSNSFNVE